MKNVGNNSRGRSQGLQGVPKIFRAPMCRAHCAVIFAIAQLSCLEMSLQKLQSHIFGIFQKNVFWKYGTDVRVDTDKRGTCPMAVVFRDGGDRDTVVRTACGHVSSSSSSPISHRGHAPASSSVIYRSTSNHLQIHAAWSDHGVVLPDEHWTPYILEYICKLRHNSTYSKSINQTIDPSIHLYFRH